MKRFHIFSLILAILLLLGLSFTACDNGSTGGGSGSFAKTNWRSSYATMEVRLSFITSEDWALYVNNLYGAGMGWVQALAGTYTVSGGTATLWMSYYESGKATISGNTLTMVGTLAQYGSSWTRE
jgi:hypothetical protein